jgi:death-on-curing protein
MGLGRPGRVDPLESDDGVLFPEVEDVVAIHTALRERTGDFDPLDDDPIEPGILNEAAFAMAVERARWGPFEQRGDVAERAAYLLRGIVRGHPFVDGNKRTGFEAAEVFLKINGWIIEAATDTVIDLARRVAMGMDTRSVHAWIRSRLRRI